MTNLAARLCAEAAAGQVLAERRTLAAVEHLVDIEPVGPLTLRGFTRPVVAASIVALSA